MKKEKWIIDRFEANWAICEDMNRCLIPLLRTDIPQEAKEGDVLIKKGNTYQIDSLETDKRRNQAIALQKRLLDRGGQKR